ncbi:MAG: AMP-binding protein [Alphaproteobacteria bacterium]|nr:AMP-binding protein [Alphaproteobacteria bacterium]
MTLLTPFLEQAARHPTRTALVMRDGRTCTFEDLHDRSVDTAARFRAAGVVRGDRVLVAIPLSDKLYVTLIAVWRLGAVAVFPEPSAGLAGLVHAAQASKPKGFAAPGWLKCLAIGFRDLRRIPINLPASVLGGRAGSDIVEPVAEDELALISFTSGSTGTPKGVLRSHGLLLAQQNALRPMMEVDAATSTDLVWFPAFVLAELALGHTSVLPDADLRKPAQADRERLGRQMEHHGVERLLGPPALCERIMGAPAPPKLKQIMTGGGPVFPLLLERLGRWAPEVAVTLVYGSSEAEPIAHVDAAQLTRADFDQMANGKGLVVGHPVPEVEITIEDDEVVVTGDHVAKGYLDPAHDEGTKVERGGKTWHRTGDAGWLDADGRLWLLGRKLERTDGLFPFAVEAMAQRWPGVEQSAFVRLDDRPVLVIAGDQSQLPLWKAKCKGIGPIELVQVASIPMDRRHQSKVDYHRLRDLLRSQTN